MTMSSDAHNMPLRDFLKRYSTCGERSTDIRSKKPCMEGPVGCRKMKGHRGKRLAFSPNLHHFISRFLPVFMSCPLTQNILPLLPTQLRDPGMPRTQWHSRVLVLFQIILLPSSAIMWTCSSDTGSVGCVCRGGGQLGITDFSNKPGK